MERRFEGKTGIVKGGAKGISRATVLRFIAEGGRVAVFDKEGGDSDFAESLRGDVGEGANRISTDVTDEGAVTVAVSNAEAEFGPADVLVNDVGLGANPRPIEDIPRSEWDKFMAINVTSAFLVTKSVLPGMRARLWSHRQSVFQCGTQRESNFECPLLDIEGGDHGLYP